MGIMQRVPTMGEDPSRDQTLISSGNIEITVAELYHHVYIKRLSDNKIAQIYGVSFQIMSPSSRNVKSPKRTTIETTSSFSTARRSVFGTWLPQYGLRAPAPGRGVPMNSPDDATMCTSTSPNDSCSPGIARRALATLRIGR